MASLNKVMLIGNLTRDAELRYIPSGQAVLEFGLAINRRFRTQDGQDKEEVCFVDINLWGKRGEAVAQYLTKGKQLFVEGRLQYDQWETDGQKRSKLRVVAENIEFLGGPRQNQGADGEGGYASAGAPAAAPRSYAREPAGSGAPASGPRPDPYGSRPSPAPIPGGVGGLGGGLGLTSDDVPF